MKALHTSGLENTQNVSNLRSRQTGAPDAGVNLDDSLITSAAATHNDVSQLGGVAGTAAAIIENSVMTAADASALGDARALRGAASAERGAVQNHQIQITNQGPLPAVTNQNDGVNKLEAPTKDFVALEATAANQLKNAQSERTMEASARHQQMQSQPAV